MQDTEVEQSALDINVLRFPLRTADKLVLAAVVIHVAVWAVLPFLMRDCLPMDSIEASAWGRHIDWGYDKNPYWNAWLARFLMEIFDYSDFGIYLGSQLSIATVFVSLWLIARDMLKPFQAFMAVFIIECSYLIHLSAIELNDNNLSMANWSITVMFFYFAVTREKIVYWVLIGIAGGIAIMTKYSAVFLFAAMFFFLLSGRDTRKFFKTPYPFITAVIAAVFVIPHALWLFENDFVTVRYLKNQTHAKASLMNHLRYPLEFIGGQAAIYLPSLLLLCAGTSRFTPRAFKALYDDIRCRFVLFIALGPVCLILLNSFLSGTVLRTMWGQQLSIFWGLLAVAWLQPAATRKNAVRFGVLLTLVFSCYATGYVVSYHFPRASSSAIFPGRELADHVTAEWRAKFHSPMAFAAGHRGLTHVMAHYGGDRPKSFVYRKIIRDKEKYWHNAENPSMSEGDLLGGSVLIWDPRDDYTGLYQIASERFPGISEVYTFTKEVEHASGTREIIVNYAFIPPKAKE